MIERMTARAVTRLEEALLAQAAIDLPEVAARRTDEGVVLEGRGLARRAVGDARLRVLGATAARSIAR